MIVNTGSVLGIDIGYSARRRSSAVCRLHWSDKEIAWEIDRYRADDKERKRVILATTGGARIEVAAFDGPLRNGFNPIGRYRAAERLLTRRLAQFIGKPGQSSTPTGQRLNLAASSCALFVRNSCNLAVSTSPVRIDERAIVEAFPSSFLGLMIKEPANVEVDRGTRSDRYFELLAKTGGLAGLMDLLLPGRVLRSQFAEVLNHDDRAGLVCALAALCVAAGQFTAVGDDDGWIILPPKRTLQPWALGLLQQNAAEEKTRSLPGRLFTS